MKTSITFLPEWKQNDLNYIVSLILEKLPQTVMIILYGSYARDKYVDFDERIEFGIVTTFMSDYDILVVTHDISDREAGKILDNIEDKYFQEHEEQTPVQFINDDIKKLNQDLSEGRYFYTQIKEEGIILYDNGKFKLAEHRELRYDEIKEQAEEYYKQKYKKANSFLQDVKNAYDREDYVQASFYLHQTCENYYYAIRLVQTLKNNKQHNLSKLSGSVRKYSDELSTVFPCNSEEEKRLFKLLKAAYVEARYNPDFDVKKEDIDALILKVELLRDITSRICEKRIDEYLKMFNDNTYIRRLETPGDKGMVAENDNTTED